MVFVTCDPSDPAQRLCGVDVGSERDHGFDVDPVLGSIEHRLADAEVGGGEHANRVIGERHSELCGVLVPPSAIEAVAASAAA